MKKYWQEFKSFAVKGNVIDLAVAVIIGGAFGKIVSSLVADVVMPLIGVIAGGVNFTSWRWILKKSVLDSSGTVLNEAVVLNIGTFLQNIFDFLVIALSIFLMVKLMARVKDSLSKENPKEEPAEDKKEEPKISPEQELLTEIRNILKNKN